MRLSLIVFAGNGPEKVKKVASADNVLEFISQVDEFMKKDNASQFRKYTPLKEALVKGSEDITKADVPQHKVLIVITDGEGSKDFQQDIEHAYNSLSKPESPEGVIELIAYKLHADEIKDSDNKTKTLIERKKFHDFKSDNWLIAPHEVKNKQELDNLLDRLRDKYSLANIPQ